MSKEREDKTEREVFGKQNSRVFAVVIAFALAAYAFKKPEKVVPDVLREAWELAKISYPNIVEAPREECRTLVASPQSSIACKIDK